MPKLAAEQEVKENKMPNLAALAAARDKVELQLTLVPSPYLVKWNETIQQLKQKIHEKEEFPIESLKIHVDGIELPDHKTLLECGISSNSNKVVRLSVASSLRVVVLYGGEETPVEVEEDDTVSNLRIKLKAIKFKLKLPQEYILLHHRNRYVMKDDQTIRWHRLRQGDVIQILQGALLV